VWPFHFSFEQFQHFMTCLIAGVVEVYAVLKLTIILWKQLKKEAKEP